MDRRETTADDTEKEEEEENYEDSLKVFDTSVGALRTSEHAVAAAFASDSLRTHT